MEITDECRYLFFFIEFFSNHFDEEKGEESRHTAAHNSEVHLFFDFRILFRVKIDEGAEHHDDNDELDQIFEMISHNNNLGCKSTIFFGISIHPSH